MSISCRLVWGEGKSLRVDQNFYMEGGDLAAEVSSVGGLIDLNTRRLVENPQDRFRELAKNPEILGL
ncbi:hypothetical protein ACIRQP_21280 [Streptomyces sp. NPDC102274]|uniref:hypothetical protein n=1 Tax=Streptomyces sp. NPDC102274 TaxID=3366151 RepID=UPI0037F57455